MSPRQTAQWLHFFQRRFNFLPDRGQLSQLWLALVESSIVSLYPQRSAVRREFRSLPADLAKTAAARYAFR